jgi:hypothetical protein
MNQLSPSSSTDLEALTERVRDWLYGHASNHTEEDTLFLMMDVERSLADVVQKAHVKHVKH